MFNEMLAQSIANASFWVLIIFAIGITVRFLIRDIIDFITVVLPDDKGKQREDE